MKGAKNEALEAIQSAFKVKMVLEARNEERRLAEIASSYTAHAPILHAWYRECLEKAINQGSGEQATCQPQAACVMKLSMC